MPGQLIRVSELDPNFKREVMAYEAARDIAACFSCGTCTGGCPIHAVYPEHDPSKIIRMINFGMKEKVLSSRYIWYCTEECFLCEKCCPQNVKFSNLWDVLKTIAVKEGYPLPVSIDENKCSGCGICVALCPYSAMELDIQDANKVAHLIITSCKGCGICGGACASGAISVNLFENENISAQIEALMG